MLYRMVFLKTLILFFTSTFFSFHANAGDEYQFIYPIHNCEKFYFKYQFIDEKFKILYPIGDTNGSEESFATPIYVKDISDLSELTDIVNEFASKLCEPPFGDTGTFRDCKVSYNLTPEYLLLNRSIADILASDSNYCENIAPLLELQDKIEGLDSLESLLQIESTFSFLKLFVDDTKDELIDHFHSCGGEEFSNKFVENMILISARDACIMPNPPGYLSWPEAKSVASKISSTYKNMSIGDISNKLDEISKKSYIEFTKLATSKQVTDLLGDKVDSVSIVENLDSFKLIEQVKAKNIPDYITDVYQTNTTIELATKAFPDLLWEKSKDKLPSTLDRKKFDEVILPYAIKEFKLCMDTPKKNLGYLTENNISKEIKKRKALKKSYCLRHKTCQEDSQNRCHAPQINLMSDDPNYSDTQVVMGCAYSGFLSGIQKILPELIKSKMDGATEEDLNKFSELGWSELSSCFNQHEKLQKRYREMQKILHPIEGDKRHYDALRGLSTDEFESALLGCADEAEISISEYYVSETIKKHPTVKAYFPQNSQALAESVMEETFRPCVAYQSGLVKSGKIEIADPNLCRPLVEMHIGTKVLQKSLSEMYDQYKVSDLQESQDIVANFQQCTQQSRENGQRAIGSQNNSNAINDLESSQKYLDNNPDFVNCIKSAIIDSSGIVSAKEFEVMIGDQKDRLTTYDAILAYRPQIQEVAKSCFKENLDSVEGYTGFLKWNDESGIDSIKEKCEMEVKKFILPKILTSEAYPQLKEIEKLGILGTRPVNILAQVSQQMLGVDAFPSESPEKDKTSWALGLAYEKYMQENPDASLEGYINNFQDLMEKRVVAQLHTTFFKKLDEQSKKYGETYPELQKVLTPGCFLELKDTLTGLSLETKRLNKKETNPVLDIDSLIEQVSNGLHYLKRLGDKQYQEQISKFKRICANPEKYKSLSEIFKTGALDFIVYQKVHDSVVKKFKGLAEDTFKEEFAFHSKSKFFDEKRNFIRLKKEQMLKLVEDKLEDPLSFHKIIFGSADRKIESFALDNISELLSETDSKAYQSLNTMITEKLFQDQNINSFSSEFTRIQLVNNLGISGYEKAYRSVEKNAAAEGWYVDDTIKMYALPELNRQWTPANIENMISWNSIAEIERKKLQTSLYQNVIYPSATGASSVDVEKGTQVVTEDLTNFTENYKYDVPYRYDSGDLHIEKMSFQDRLATRIRSYVKKNVGTWDALKEAWREF